MSRPSPAPCGSTPHAWTGRARTIGPHVRRLRTRLPRLPIPGTLAACALAACACVTSVRVGSAAAQTPRDTRAPARRDTTDTPLLPGDVAREAESRYNAPGTTRTAGAYVIPAGRTVEGDVAVLGGPVTVAGRITGRLTAINADVTFRPGARVDGDVFVVGGLVDGRSGAQLGGELRIYRQPLRYTREGERLVAEAGEEREWPFRWRRSRGRRPYAGVTLSSGHTYNRVEGLPIWFGPSYEQDFGQARLSVDVFGIFRTAEQFAWDSANVGHLARAELRLGRGRGVRVGGRLYDEVAAVEEWQLGLAETGLAAFLARRDFRDYYNRHGGTVYAALQGSADASVTVALSDQRWAARAAREVFTLFRNDGTWRENPAADEGRVHLLNTTLRVDTRNDEDRPWAGWYVEADYERGTGGFTGIAPTSANLLVGSAAVPPGTLGARDLRPGRRSYGRGFLDLRRYNRLSPDAQLNLRLVLGGWLHGDELPLQRRLSLTGPGAIAGLDFRRATRADDLALCSVAGVSPAGTPAQCERVALVQAEYRGDVRVALGGSDDAEPRFRRRGLRTEASWVVFADAGRGWLLGEPSGGRGEELMVAKGRFPAFDSFLTDVGVGVELGRNRASQVGGLGVYVAKSVSRPSQGANLFVRIERRF